MNKTQNLIAVLADVMQNLNAPERPSGPDTRRLTPRQRAIEIAASGVRLALILGHED